MNIMKKTLGLATISIFILLIEACNTATQIPAPMTPNPPSATPIPASATPNPPSATPVPLPTVIPTQITLTPNPALAARLEGLWQGSNGSYYKFYPDGTWHWHQILDQVENAPENTGKWWVEGDVFYIVDLTGFGKCPESQVGSYQASIQDAALKLVLANDECKVRARQTVGIYKHLP